MHARTHADARAHTDMHTPTYTLMPVLIQTHIYLHGSAILFVELLVLPPAASHTLLFVFWPRIQHVAEEAS